MISFTNILNINTRTPKRQKPLAGVMQNKQVSKNAYRPIYCRRNGFVLERTFTVSVLIA